ncbi:MAG: ABC transporter permease [Spirochaetes bacterium]|nr:ABC transporter permease [Spirochaetota bacterium]
MNQVRRFLTNNAVSILFVVIGVLGLRVSGLSLPFFLEDIVNRLARNSFMVLSLIIPVLAGLGLNFAIVLGAMAGQAAIIVVTHWKIPGVGGILLSILLAFPLAVVLGILTGRLLNRARGKEMITTLILGFFSNGIYQLVFLLLVGSVIPMKNDVLVLSSGVGLRTSIDLTGGLKNGLDDLLRMPFPLCAAVTGVILLGVYLVKFFRKDSIRLSKLLGIGVIAVFLIGWGLYQVYTRSMFNFVRVPVGTFIIVLGLCIFILFFTRTKLGQDMRTVGQDRHIAEVAGIDSDRIRIIAMVMSTVLAFIGKLICL